MSLKQRKIKFKPRIKLNHNIYISSSGFKAVGRSTLTQCKRFGKNENLIRAASCFNKGLE